METLDGTRKRPGTAARRRGRSLVIAVALAAAASVQTARADVAAVRVGWFENPVFIASASGERKFLYIVEQGGTVRILKNGAVRANPFLNIRDRVHGPGDPGAGGEQGLLSIAFAPDYKTSGLFYVAYTAKTGDLKIEEYRRSDDNRRRADKSSRRQLLSVKHRDAQNHNGGQLQFGPDGFLFISTGDGGGSGDPGDNARRKGRLPGKILRIDPAPGDGLPYSIPGTNPFNGMKGRDEVFAYGLRNTWRFSFHKKTILLADVGQFDWEEVNVVKKRHARGANFGWPQYEGNAIFDADRPGDDPPTFPALVYGHGSGACSVTGGYVVTDADLPDLKGRYVYADYCLGEIRSFPPGDPGDDQSTGLTLPFPTSFGTGPKGEIYVSQSNGKVSRLVSAPPD